MRGKELEQEALAEATYLVEERATTRETGKHFNVSKTTVADHIHLIVKNLDNHLHDQAIGQMYCNKHHLQPHNPEFN